MNTGLTTDGANKDVVLAVLLEKFKNLEQDLQEAQREIKSLKQDKDRALKWGIVVLGSALMGIGTWAVELFTNHILNK